MTKQKKPSYKMFQAELEQSKDQALRMSEAYRSEERKVAGLINSLRESTERLAKLEREVAWFKQLTQQMSEAVCAYMRGRA